jgi:transcriptional regulator with XRE-family HTH domain
MTATAVLSSLGSRLRAARERQGSSLDDVSAQTGLSKAHLSRIESGERQPAIATLLTLAAALGVRVGALLGEDAIAGSLGLHPPGEEPREDALGLRIEACSGFDGSRDLNALRVHIGPDRVPPPFSTHPGEEWLYVTLGSVHLEYAGRVEVLGPGTAAHFDSNQPHRLSAPEGDAELVLVATSPPQRRPERHY